MGWQGRLFELAAVDSVVSSSGTATLFAGCRDVWRISSSDAHRVAACPHRILQAQDEPRGIWARHTNGSKANVPRGAIELYSPDTGNAIAGKDPMLPSVALGDGRVGLLRDGKLKLVLRDAKGKLTVAKATAREEDELASNGEVVAVYRETPGSLRVYGTKVEPIWQLEIECRPNGGAPVHIADDTLVVRTKNALVGLDLATGKQRWELPTDRGWRCHLDSPSIVLTRETTIVRVEHSSGRELAKLTVRDVQFPRSGSRGIAREIGPEIVYGATHTDRVLVLDALGKTLEAFELPLTHRLSNIEGASEGHIAIATHRADGPLAMSIAGALHVTRGPSNISADPRPEVEVSVEKVGAGTRYRHHVHEQDAARFARFATLALVESARLRGRHVRQSPATRDHKFTGELVLVLARAQKDTAIAAEAERAADTVALLSEDVTGVREAPLRVSVVFE